MRRLPKIGDKKTFIPHAFKEGCVPPNSRQLTGRVIYVHPQGRFYIVEAESNGIKIRETFYPET